jgi:hypothetical protein
MGKKMCVCRRWLIGMVPCMILVAQLSDAEDMAGAKLAPVGTAFSYQGRLSDGGSPANGVYDIRFDMYDAATGGTWIGGSSVYVDNIAVVDGLVSAEIDRGYLTFSDEARWLEIAVKADGAGSYVVLSPRQRLNPTPYASSAQRLGIHAEDYFIDTSASDQEKSGSLSILGGAHLVSADGWAVEAWGATGGGSFYQDSGVNQALLAWNNKGVEGHGVWAGGYFEESDSDAQARVASGSSGIRAKGSEVGGHFYDTDGSGVADVGYGGLGIEASGNEAGGHFLDSNATGEAWVGINDTGVQGYGNVAGGYFLDTNSSVGAFVAYNTYKIYGGGQVSFVQNHPEDPDRVIVYTAPEGDEAATYTRGSARLENGHAKVPLAETFRWVTNPDIGLTVHLTPRGEWSDLYVVSVTTSELEVASREGASDAAFDYLVYGLRIGFEETSVVQEKHLEFPIPSMRDHQALYLAQPELRQYSSLDRFSGMRAALGDEKPLDLSAANALRDAIDASVSQTLNAALPEGDPGLESEPADTAVPHAPHVAAAAVDRQIDDGPTAKQRAQTAALDDAERVAGLQPPSLPGLATLMPASQAVSPGDVVAADPADMSRVRPAATMADPTVVGIAVAEPGAAVAPRSEVASTAGEAVSEEVAVRQAGVVLCRVDAGYGAIRPGDLLTASATPGHAALALDPRPGTVVAKALEPLEYGTGLIRVLVLLR